jgi:hypothetical protein
MPQKAKEWKWIREGIKFHALQQNRLLQLRPDPLPHPEKYQHLEKFQVTKSKHLELER